MGVSNEKRCKKVDFKSDLLHFLKVDFLKVDFLKVDFLKVDKVDLDVVNHRQCQTKAIIHII